MEESSEVEVRTSPTVISIQDFMLIHDATTLRTKEKKNNRHINVISLIREMIKQHQEH